MDRLYQSIVTFGRGRIFAFRPGHKEYPIFFQDEVRRVLANDVAWATPNEGTKANWTGVESIEPIDE